MKTQIWLQLKKFSFIIITVYLLYGKLFGQKMLSAKQQEYWYKKKNGEKQPLISLSLVALSWS